MTEEETLEEINLEEHINEKEEQETKVPNKIPEPKKELKAEPDSLGLPKLEAEPIKLPELKTILTDTKLNDLIPEPEPTNWTANPLGDLIKHFEKKYKNANKSTLKDIVTTTWEASNRQTLKDIQNTPTFKAGAGILNKMFKKK